MNALAIMLTPYRHGWAVTLSNGRELRPLYRAWRQTQSAPVRSKPLRA